MGSIRKRSLPFAGPNQYYRTQFRGFLPEVPDRVINYNMTSNWSPMIGTQVTESENHAGWRTGLVIDNLTVRHVIQDTGGAFTMQKSYVENPFFTVSQVRDSGWYPSPTGQTKTQIREYTEQAILPLPPASMPFPPSAKSSEIDLMKYGTTAIARCAPSNNVANLLTSLIELYRDGLPHLFGASSWEARTRGIREARQSLGDEYLNVQFGWKPLLSDIQDFASGVTNLSKLYKQLQKDNGRVVRRRYGFPPIRTETNTTVKSNCSPYGVGGTDVIGWYDTSKWNQGSVVRNRQTSIDRWFSGAFTQYLPDLGDSFVDHATRAIDVLGLDLDLEVLWNAAPWSWAVDWFSNTGDLIHNMNRWSTDGLVLKYGYIMEHSVVRDKYTFVGPTGMKPVSTYPPSVTLVTETKIRRRATPFGFGLTLSGFTNQQKAIVAALGISRV